MRSSNKPLLQGSGKTRQNNMSDGLRLTYYAERQATQISNQAKTVRLLFLLPSPTYQPTWHILFRTDAGHLLPAFQGYFFPPADLL